MITTVVFLPTVLLAQNSQPCNQALFKDTLLDKLTGQWALSGQIGNRTVANHFTAQWVLNHQFIELDFVDTGSPPGYVAKVSIGYDCISEKYVIHWLDSYGARFSETLGFGTKTSDTIECRFEYPDAPFVTKFCYHSKQDAWQINMTTKNKEGEWTVFGEEWLTRKKE